MADPMKIRARRLEAPTGAVIKVLMSHPMETGQRKDEDGHVVPAWFIQTVQVRWNDQTVLTADWGPAISKNPFLQLELPAAIPGDRISVTWRDSRGDTRTDEVQVT